MDDERPQGCVHRVSDAFIGVVCIITGLLMIAALVLLSGLPPKDAWHAVGVGLGICLYSVVAELFILLGLERCLGPQNWLSASMPRSVVGLAGWVLITALVLVACVFFLLW